MDKGFRIIRDPWGNFSAEGFFPRDGMQWFKSATGFKSEAEARQWVYDQQAKDREEADDKSPWRPASVSL